MRTSKFTYKQSADQVYAFASDPEYVRQRSEAMGETNINITKTGDTVKNVRTVVAQVPGFAAKVLKPTNTVVEIKAWNASNKTASLSVDVQGAPTKLTGTIRIYDNPGGGCTYETEYTASCSIPLIGKKIAEYVEKVTHEGMETEFHWNQKKLDALG